MAVRSDFLTSCCQRDFRTIPLKFQNNQDWKHKLPVRGNNIADVSLSPDNSLRKKKIPTRNDLSCLLYCTDCRRCLIMNNNTERGAELTVLRLGFLGRRKKKRSSDHFLKKTFLASRYFWSSLKFFPVIAIPPKESHYYGEMIWANK